ncbi:MAG TPA: UDP-N-acetylglucosamine--N-acetylmuramyl-(pentapeptide) pyrophosphoryl-undecaprenol N-acetylglucosamine transferase, partial [Porphyromonadaceae bacterium]|nr:UDP-N-acetylglucosamine--N-acetylmuramyl-(pentapeptide) pyrophosphoryl-undecaprenol N-acetylglucosamine transferase [Porphyromonadaceae bacterium]
MKEDLPTLFLVGGSLGAGTMKRSVMHSIQSLKEKRVQLLWQCGKYYYENMK